MISRRTFLNCSLGAGVSVLSLVRATKAEDIRRGRTGAPYGLTRDVPTKLFDSQRCWCHPRAGVVPGAGQGGLPRVVMTMNTLNLAGSDVFQAMYGLRTDDLGKTWSEPREIEAMAPRFEMIDGQNRPVAASDFWPRWHAASKTLLGTGHSVVYTADWKVVPVRPRHTVYSSYDPQTERWASWRKLEMPDGPKFGNAGAGCTQRVDLPDGSRSRPCVARK
jgi:hypothetical protein